MARLSQGILGGISGKIGNVVGSSWKGIAVIKTKALSVANPKTAGQLAQRGAMRNCVAFATPILASIIKPLNDRFASGMSGFNLFVSRNIQYFDQVDIDDIASIEISKGKMVAIALTSVVADRSLNSVVVNFPTTLLDAYAQATDKLYISVYNEQKADFLTSSGSVLRSAGTISMVMPASWAASDFIFIHAAFLRSDGTVASDTSYLEGQIIA